MKSPARPDLLVVDLDPARLRAEITARRRHLETVEDVRRLRRLRRTLAEAERAEA